MQTIDFWCELASPYAYLAASRIEPLAKAAGLPVRWRPFSLGPIFKASGWETSPFEIYASKGRYMWRDVEREADRLGIPFQKPRAFPQNTVLAAKLAIVGMEPGRGWGVPFVQKTMRANFGEDRDVASPDVLFEILADLGIDAAAAHHDAVTPPRSSALRAATEEAARLGIFGAPTFLVGTEMFWGNDRLESAIAWASRA